MINEKGQLFGKINIFDFVIVILLVLLIFGGSYKLFVVDLQKTGNMKEITYELVIESVRDVTFEAFNDGEDVVDYDAKGKIGEVVSVRKEPARRQLSTLDGQVLYAPAEARYDVYVTVKADAEIVTTGSLYVGKTAIADGSEVHITTQKTNCIATFKNVTIK